MTETFLASRIRAVHANPAEKLDDLLVIAAMVQRMETALDELVGQASADAWMEMPRGTAARRCTTP